MYNINVLLAGQTGVGRSTLINMITGAADGSTRAAKVSNDVRPCPIEMTVHTAALDVDDGTSLQCQLWDTRGLDEAVDHPNLIGSAAHWLRQQGVAAFSRRGLPSDSERDLKDVCRQRVHGLGEGGPSSPRSPAIVVLVWCIHASKIDVPIHWEHFRQVYVQYCDRKVKPVIVVNQMTPSLAEEWEERCIEQLEMLNLGIGLDDTSDLLMRVRKFRDTSSLEYREDALALRNLLLRLSDRMPSTRAA